MKGKDADAAIRIGIGPGMGGRGVVDGQHLQHMLTGEGDVVDEALEVAEVAYAKRVFAAQGEHGDERAGHTSVVEGEEGLVEVVDHHLPTLKGGELDGTVVAALPDDIALVVADGNELKLSLLVGEHIGIEVDDPFVVVVLGHGNALAGIPVAQFLPLADDDQALAGTQLRRTHHKTHGVGERRRRKLLALTAVEAVGERRAVEIGVLRHVVPMIIDGETAAAGVVELQEMGQRGPFAAHTTAVALDVVIITYRIGESGRHVKVVRPPHAIRRHHSVLGCCIAVDKVQHYFFAELCTVVNIEF